MCHLFLALRQKGIHCLLLFASALHGQTVRVLLEEPIDTDISHASNEPHLIVDPTDDQHLLVATVQDSAAIPQGLDGPPTEHTRTPPVP